jgi:hypothetical protein
MNLVAARDAVDTQSPVVISYHNTIFNRSGLQTHGRRPH